MKSLSESTIRDLAGKAVYQRGLNYYNEGRVGELSISGTRITANVDGTQSYRVTLNHTVKIFDGSCNCPASDHFDFCKHCVAAALSYYYQTQIILELTESSTAKDRVLPFLQTLTKPQLADQLHKLIQRDTALHDEWLLRAEIASGGLSVAELRKRITKAIPYKPSGLWRYREVADYFDKCERVLEMLEAPVLSMAGPSISKLAIYAIQRLQKTLESIDDSGGYRFPLELRLQHWFAVALEANDWDDNQKGELVTSMILDTKFDYDLLDLPDGVADQLGVADLQYVYEALTKEWQSLKPPSNTSADHDRYRYFRIQALLLARAQAQGNVDVELEILVTAAVNVRQSLKLVNRCIELNRLPEAEKWLDYANKVETLTPHHQIQIEDVQIALWLAQGDYQTALTVQWERYAEDEDPRSLRAVLKTAAYLDERDHWLTKAISQLMARISPQLKTQKNQQRVENLVAIYLDEDQVSEAIALDSQYPLHPSTLMGIVNATPQLSKPTFKLIERAANYLVGLGNNEVYDRAIEFLKKQPAKLTEDQQELFEALITRIYSKPDNLRKTNFVKSLKSAFPFLIKPR